MCHTITHNKFCLPEQITRFVPILTASSCLKCHKFRTEEWLVGNLNESKFSKRCGSKNCAFRCYFVEYFLFHCYNSFAHRFISLNLISVGGIGPIMNCFGLAMACLENLMWHLMIAFTNMKRLPSHAVQTVEVLMTANTVKVKEAERAYQPRCINFSSISVWQYSRWLGQRVSEMDEPFDVHPTRRRAIF